MLGKAFECKYLYMRPTQIQKLPFQPQSVYQQVNSPYIIQTKEVENRNRHHWLSLIPAFKADGTTNVN